MRIQLGRNAVADRDDGLRIVLAQSIDLPHAETQREGVVCVRYRASRTSAGGSSVQSHRL